MKFQTKTITLFLPSHQTVPSEEVKPKKMGSSTSKTPVRRSEVEVQKQIGQGGMGVVFLGHQQLLERNVAIKRLKKQSQRLADALIHEAKITGNLEHPNIIPIHSVNILEDEEPEVIMKYIQGTSFNHKISEAPEESEIRENLQILIQICHPLEFAHAQGIIHRDIKPENVMLGSFGEVYLLDWGLAFQMSQADKEPSGLVGTPAYMAPEMLLGEPKKINISTDVYLLGACLHHILTGKPKHSGTSIKEALHNVRRSKPYLYPNGLMSLIGSVANKACSAQMNLRHQSVEEFRKDISNILKRWEALQLIETAEDLLGELQSMQTSSHLDQLQAHAVFNQAKFAFEQSLKLFPNNHEAPKGIKRAIVMMTDLMIQLEQYTYAQDLLKESNIQDPALQNRIKMALAKQIEHDNHQKSLEEEVQRHNPQFSGKFRSSISLSLFGLSGIFIVLVGLYEYLVAPLQSSIPIILLASTAVMALIIQKKNLSPKVLKNHVTKQITNILQWGHGTVALLGLHFKFFPEQEWDIPLISILFWGFAYGSLYPIFRAGTLFFGLSVGVFVLQPYVHISSYLLMSIFYLLCNITLFVQWRK